MKIVNKIKSFPNFLREVILEMKKVNWPTKKETIKYTLIVVLVSFVIAAFLGGLDYLFSTIINRIML